MLGIATAIDAACAERPAAPPHRNALRAVADELLQLVHQLQAGLASADTVALQLAVERLQSHLYLTASQLLPEWRNLCGDGSAVDQAEVRLGQLRHLVDVVLDRGPDDVMHTARCVVLCDELQRHRDRNAVLLQALDAVLDDDALQAIGSVWRVESVRLELARREGAAAEMDNEDADPVGQPPQ